MVPRCNHHPALWDRNKKISSNQTGPCFGGMLLLVVVTRDDDPSSRIVDMVPQRERSKRVLARPLAYLRIEIDSCLLLEWSESSKVLEWSFDED